MNLDALALSLGHRPEISPEGVLKPTTGSFERKKCPTSRYASSTAHDFLNPINKAAVSIGRD